MHTRQCGSAPDEGISASLAFGHLSAFPDYPGHSPTRRLIADIARLYDFAPTFFRFGVCSFFDPMDDELSSSLTHLETVPGDRT